MTVDLHLKDDYTAAQCCDPSPPCKIIGYYSHDNLLKVHRSDCLNLKKADAARLVHLNWPDIPADRPFTPESDFKQLDRTDFRVLQHHREFGIDYSLLVARKLGIPKEEAFDRHKKLREMELIQRVEPTMVQYRKGLTPNKWIKHRNHTYFDLTPKGTNYLAHYESAKS